MRLPKTLPMLALLAAITAAQTSPTPTCFTINAASAIPSLPTIPVSYYGALWVHFTVPSSATVDRLDVWGPGGTVDFPGVKYDVYQTPSFGVPAPGQSLATFSGLISQGTGHTWAILTTPTPVTLNPAATYAFSIKAYPNSSSLPLFQTICLGLPHDPNAATQLPYQYLPYNNCGTTFPTSGTVGIVAAFKNLSCGPGPLANAEFGGSGCGQGPHPYPPAFLNTFTPPVLGSSWQLQLVGPAGGSAYVFWSTGFNPNGFPISAATSCLCFLEPLSFFTLQSQGLQPLVHGVLPSAPLPSSSITWTFTLPSGPFYAGFNFTGQGAIVSPFGTIPVDSGLFAQTTNAVRVTLGY